MGEYIVGLLLTLIAFFILPAFRYVSLKIFSKNEGRPELWYLPKYGFRLVIRNLPRKKTLKDIRYRVFIRRIIPASEGSSVATFDDEHLFACDDFFLFQGTDQTLLSFNLKGEHDEKVNFVQTDKLGRELRDIRLKDFDCLICDYSATIQNFFNFNIKLAKRVELKASSLREMWRAIQANDTERRFKIDQIRDIW